MNEVVELKLLKNILLKDINDRVELYNLKFEQERKLSLDINAMVGEEKRLAIKSRCTLTEDNHKRCGVLKGLKLAVHRIDGRLKFLGVEK